MASIMTTDYSAMIATLTQKRDTLRFEIAAINEAIQALQHAQSPASAPVSERSLQMTQPPEPTFQLNATSSTRFPDRDFSRISVRWACLWMLSDASHDGLTTSEIAEELILGGKKSGAYSYVSAVSAVLSSMKAKGELIQDGNRWKLTHIGRLAWNVIEPQAKLQLTRVVP